MDIEIATANEFTNCSQVDHASLTATHSGFNHPAMLTTSTAG